MKYIYVFVLACSVIVCFLAVGPGWCGQATWSPEYRQENTTKVYNAGYDEVFDAVVKVLETNAYPVLKKNKDNGIIITDFISGGRVLLGRERLNFNIYRLTTDSTKVQLYIEYEYPDKSGERNIDNFINVSDYEKVFDALQAILDDNPENAVIHR